MIIDVFDFDKTIYDGDSSVDFYLFCLRRNPGILKYVPLLIIAAAKYILSRNGKTQFKQTAFSFLNSIKDTEQSVEAFWSVNEYKIKDWYKERDHGSDVIISASPDFLLRPVCMRLGVRQLIASEVDAQNGRFNGENCFGAEKVRRQDPSLVGNHIAASSRASFTMSVNVFSLSADVVSSCVTRLSLIVKMASAFAPSLAAFM